MKNEITLSYEPPVDKIKKFVFSRGRRNGLIGIKCPRRDGITPTTNSYRLHLASLCFPMIEL